MTCSNLISKRNSDDFCVNMYRMGAHYRNKTTGTEQDFDIERIYIHPDYNLYPADYDNDIALIRLKRPAILNSWTQLACLPTDAEQFAAGTNCYISGWGTLKSGGDSPDVLHQAKVFDTGL
jgi:secreted trypsin-like serine protease